MERYTVLSKNRSIYSQVGSPVVIAGQATLVDNELHQAIGQIKFNNMSDKTIVSMTLRVRCFAVDGQELQGIEEYRYIGINAQKGDYFGENNAIILPDSLTYSIKVQVRAVFFNDSTCWESDAEPIEMKMPVKLESFLNREEIEAYRDNYCRKGEYAFAKNDALWICACGELQTAKSMYCSACGTSRQRLEGFTREALNELVAKKKQQKAEEEAAIAAKKEEVRRKINKWKIPAIILVVLLCLGGFFYKLLADNEYSFSNVGKILSGNFGCISGHTLEPATCQHGKVCVNCGAEFGVKIDHKFDKNSCVHKMTCEMCGLETGEFGPHLFKLATCTDPQICTVCGAEGNPALGHDTDFGKCSRCGELFGFGDLEQIRYNVERGVSESANAIRYLADLKGGWVGPYDAICKYIKQDVGTTVNTSKNAAALCDNFDNEMLQSLKEKLLVVETKRPMTFPTVEDNSEKTFAKCKEELEALYGAMKQAQNKLDEIMKLFK